MFIEVKNLPDCRRVPVKGREVLLGVGVCGCSGWVCIMSAMLFDVFFIEMINMLEKSTDEVSNASRSTPACCGCCSVELNTHPCKVGQECARHCGVSALLWRVRADNTRRCLEKSH
jgi:hypothetical protein